MRKAGDDLKAKIGGAVEQLKKLTGGSVRVWRYVDSQDALFGFVTSDPILGEDGKEKNFEDFVAFLRPDVDLRPKEARLIAQHDEADDSSPLWDVRPKGVHLLLRDQSLELSLLTHEDNSEVTETLGVICIDITKASYLAFEIDRKGRIGGFFDIIRRALRTYSLHQLKKGFDKAREFLGRPSDVPKITTEEDVKRQLDNLIRNLSKDDVKRQLDDLIQKLNVDPSTISVYVRGIDRVTSESSTNPLIAGVGNLFDVLVDAENAARPSPVWADYQEHMFSHHAQRQLQEDPKLEGVMFPGGGNSADFDEHWDWLAKAQTYLLDAVADPVLKERIKTTTDDMVNHGSFGVFPIRWVTGEGNRGPLVGLLCVASQNTRYFFTWTRQLLLEHFCLWLGRRHSDLGPFLDSIHPRTHAPVMESIDVLRKVAPRSVLFSQPTKDEQQCFAFILSVDIRKSTELMARMESAYADRYGDVLIGLWNNMKRVVLEEYGIFDKFTGDGILAYFPDFFEVNRRSAAVRLLRSVERCHDEFRKAYPTMWEALGAVPAMGSPADRSPGRVGLGIGLDFGSVRLVNVGTELTVVGTPVVYACRLASAAWGFTTLANYPCYRAFKLSGILDVVDCTPISVEIKHEEIHAYRVSRRSWLDAPEPKLKDEEAKRWDHEWLTKPVSNAG